MENAMETNVLSRLLEPIAGCLTPSVATKIACLRAEPQIQARLDELADKCNEGLLTEEERVEYEAYVEALDVIGILQAKARSLI